MVSGGTVYLVEAGTVLGVVGVRREGRVREAPEGGEENGRRTREAAVMILMGRCESEGTMDGTGKSGVPLGEIQRPVDEGLVGFVVRLWREVCIPLPHGFVP